MFSSHGYDLEKLSASLNAVKSAFNRDKISLASISHCFMPDRFAPYENYVYNFASLDYDCCSVQELKENFRKQAETMFAAGADGFKMLEGKTTSRKISGLPLNDNVYDLFFKFMEDNKFPVLMHVADPEEFWDAEKVSEHAKAAGWFYGDGSFPSKETLYREAEGILEKFPNLKITFAHFFFLSADLDRAEAFLKKWPAVNFDLTPGREMYVNFSKKSPAWRDFFIRHQDRLIFGSDSYLSINSILEKDFEWNTGIMKDIMTFLSTGKEVFSGKGLNLDEKTLRKIYGENFKSTLLFASPRKPDLKLLSRECGARLKLISETKENSFVLENFRKISAKLQELC
jgi:predicted TIM-barrel fold metal-dependent hydrolase